MTEQTNAAVIQKFFGRREGQDLKGFFEELKQLSEGDKQQLADGIRNGSFSY